MSDKGQMVRALRFSSDRGALTGFARRVLFLLAACAVFGPGTAGAARAQESSKADAGRDLQSGAASRADESDEIVVRLETPVEGARFYYRASEGTLRGLAEEHETVPEAPYVFLCTAPCDTKLPRGAYRIALSTGTGAPVEARNWVFLETPGTLHGRYIGRSRLRTTAWIVAPALLLAGIGVMVGADSWSSSSGGSFQSCAHNVDPAVNCAREANQSQTGPEALWIAGFVTALLSAPAFLVLITRPDEVEVSASQDRPLVAPVSLLPSLGREGRTGTLAPALSVQLSF